MSKSKKVTDVVADVLVAKLGLSPADAARRAKSLSPEHRSAVETIGRLPMANNLLGSFFDLLAHERQASEETDAGKKAKLSQSLVEAKNAFDQALAEIIAQVPPVAEASTDETGEGNQSGESSTGTESKAEKKKK